jgi:large subunit ribosomal protein L18
LLTLYEGDIMIIKKNRKAATIKRHIRIRVKLSGTTERPRLCVHRTTKHIYAQVIDDIKGITLVAAASVEEAVKGKFSHGGNIDAAKAVGKLVAEKAIKAGIEDVVFDRGGFVYHGRIAALAEAAREAGLKF